MTRTRVPELIRRMRCEETRGAWQVRRPDHRGMRRTRYETIYEISTFPARSPTRSRGDFLRSEGGSSLSRPCAGPIPCLPMETDAAWKRLFALPAMVEHLLRAVAPELARRLDFTAMEQLAANWTRPTGGAGARPGTRPTDGADPHTGARPTGGTEPHTGTRPTGGTEPRTGARPTGGANQRPGAQRYADAVWRIRYAGADTGADVRTLVLLLEFQSTVDSDMAARVLAYTSLLREHLRRQGPARPRRRAAHPGRGGLLRAEAVVGGGRRRRRAALARRHAAAAGRRPLPAA